MTEKRKQELRQLLEEAMGSLEVRQGYGQALDLPIDALQKKEI